jgi:hypothetical protein
MADGNFTVPLDLPQDEATAFADLLQRTSYEDCVRRANKLKHYRDGRAEADVMWAALRLVEGQLLAGFRRKQPPFP